MRIRSQVYALVPLWMSFGSVAALKEPEICYVLDAILLLYGVILTALYCRLKIQKIKAVQAQNDKPKKAEEGIYTGLTPHAPDTYETIGMKKGLDG